ncbi:hypothetical protein AAFF_G00295580 [Aldrovandia affinis]|uniref:Uncharacterized protein n=1 Tax=Aldrovandia affinis TaxID=143900 RepID=A0AAD7SR59_9TELE|nr:hypothetical protein AAFF_G00295580 [Aldrovandia affinis]
MPLVAYPDPGHQWTMGPRDPLLVQRNWGVDMVYDVVKDYAYAGLLKNVLVSGLLPPIKDRVVTTCIGQETGATHPDVWARAKYAEQQEAQKEGKKKVKVETAQSMFYQGGQSGRGGQDRGRSGGCTEDVAGDTVPTTAASATLNGHET